MDEAEKMGLEVAKAGLEKAKEFAGKLVTPAIEEAGGILQDTVKYWRVKNQVKILLKAKKYFEKKGLDPQHVPLKVLVPLLENGSLEDDESIQDKWAALLANAADPDTSDSVSPTFPQILKELSPKEVALLDKIYDEIVSRPDDERFTIQFEKQKIVVHFRMPSEDFDVIVDNLSRLGLCQPPTTGGGMTFREYSVVIRTYDFFCITPLGYKFVKACRFKD